MVTVKQGKKQKAAEEEKLDCETGEDGTPWRRDPVGEISWDSKDYRIGTKDDPKTRHFVLTIKVKARCSDDPKDAEEEVWVEWRGDVTWEKREVKTSNEHVFVGPD